MSRTAVNAGRRMTITADRTMTAGDFIFFQGFFGTVDDDAVSGELVSLILDGGVRILKNIFGSTIARGTTIYAYASNVNSGTTVQLFPAASAPTTAVIVGRAWATGVASSATATLKVALFHPNDRA